MDAKQDQVIAPPRLGRYEIDTKNSTVSFKTKHLFGLGGVRGSFAVKSGTVDVAEPVGDSSIRVEIDTASFDSGHEQRDGAVRSDKFLDAAGHPVITFVSTGVEGGTVTGSLTVRKVTKPVTLTVETSDVSPTGFSVRATTRIDRTEFGVTAARGMAGRHLDMTLEISCVRA